MSRIRGVNTKPEVLIKRFLRDLKIPFKSNYKLLPGTTDIYIPDLHLVIQVHCCFWHGHKHCQYFKLPKSNVNFWKLKIESNIKRDKKVLRRLTQRGYKVCQLWECDIRIGKALAKLLRYK
jgi:DNA mismatch endonuclease (patch repair protein)